MYATTDTLLPLAPGSLSAPGATRPTMVDADETAAVAAPVEIPAQRRPVDEADWQLDHEELSVARARQLAREVLAQWGIPEKAADAAVLVVSELVTNAVEHAQPPLLLHLHREHAGYRVWIGVTDGGPALQEGEWMRSCAPEEHGRGLGLVHALAQALGTRHHTGGTTRWARMTAA